jgi:TolB protein
MGPIVGAPTRRRRDLVLLATVALAVAGVVAACGSQEPSRSPQGSVAALPTPIASLPATPTPTASQPAAGPMGSFGPIASSGAIALLGEDGSLSIVDPGGRSVLLSDTGVQALGLPTWSPDGSRLAVVRSSRTEASIVVFDATSVSSGRAAEPRVIFRSDSIGPFYLYWTPDGRDVSFLANESGDLSLRLAPADGSAPLDGSGPGAFVRSGNPFYFDWVESDRLLVHIGAGPEAFLGEMRLDGSLADDELAAPGAFRSATVSPDGRSIAFVRSGEGGASEIVVAARDGSDERVMPVFDVAAVLFDPRGASVAAIGPDQPVQASSGFPVGPLRVLDVATGDVRTVLDGAVVGFWWSPDGATIAALRIQRVTPPAADARSLPSPAATTTPSAEIRLVFVDPATGEIRSDPAVRPGQRFIEALLPYFDQYALSHRLWAPDSSSFLMPELGPDGVTQVMVRFPDGSPPTALPGEMGFWSP